MSEDTARLQSRFSRRLEEQLRLKRFFTKLISETLQINATEVTFQIESGSMLVRLLVDNIEHKRISISEEWFPLVITWLEQRWSPLAEMCPSDQHTVSRAHFFPIQIRYAGSIFTAVVRKEPDLLVLENIHHYTCYQAVESLLAFSKKQQIELREILTHDRGLIAVVVPQGQQLVRGVSTLLGLTGGFFGGDLQEKTVRTLALHLAEKELILVSWQADSIGQALEALANEIGPAWSGVFKGIVGITFVPALCNACAAPGLLPQQLEQQLSAASPANAARYRTVVGCQRCKNTGFRGWESAVQAKVIDSDAFTFLGEAAGRPKVEEFLRTFGVSPFERQGIRHAYEGRVTYEGLLSAIDSFKTLSNLSDNPIIVDDNFFTLENNEPSARSRKDTSPLTTGTIDNLIRARDESLVAVTQVAINKGNLTILIVEDDDDQRTLLEVILKNEGYAVHAVVNGLQALGHLNKTKPHLVITDIMMPELNGKELVAAMKNDARLSDIPVLVLTVLNDSDKEFEMLDMGVDDFCEKAIPRKVLLKRVHNILRRFYTVQGS